MTLSHFGQMNALDTQPMEGNVFGIKFDLPSHTGDKAKEWKSEKPAVDMRWYVAERAVLRAVLLIGLEEHIVYGKGLKQYVLTDNGVVAHFTDGTTQEGTLLVGADGLRSPVRQQLIPEYRPIDTTGRCIYGRTPLTEETSGKIHPMIPQYFSFFTDKRPETQLCLLFQPIKFSKEIPVEVKEKIPKVDNYVFWVLISNQKTFNMEDSKFLKLSNQEAAQLAIDMTKDWDPSIKMLFELQDVSQASALRFSSATTNIPAWTPSANVTLIGDAAHTMSPTSGAGANTALKDSADLCRVIVEEGISAESIGRFEEQMRQYAQKQIELGFANAKGLWNHPPMEECKPVDF